MNMPHPLAPPPAPRRRAAIAQAAGRVVAGLALGLAAWAADAHAAVPAPATAGADFGSTRASRAALAVANAVVRSADNAGAPFIILDKVAARVFVFDPAGRLQAHAPALLGLAKGDDSVPGIGDRKIADITPQERTTPAGRFVAEFGHSSSRGEDVVWVDYDAAVSMHRVVTTNPKERRLQRLATPTPRDNRISYGCVNLPKAFYERWVGPTVAHTRTIIYVLPETRRPQEVFAFLQGTRMAASGTAAARPSVIAATPPTTTRAAWSGTRPLRAGPRDGPMPVIDQ